MDLFQHIVSQGVSPDDAFELLERKQKQPLLRGISLRGKWITLCLPNIEKFDEMVESGVPPASSTDREFMMGVCNGNQFEKKPQLGDFYKQEAEKRGGSVTGKKYLSQLARFPGDPEAYVSGRGDVERVCRERGWGCDVDGAVKVAIVDKREEPKPVPINEKIVEREAANVLEGQTVSRKEYNKVKDQVRERITPRSKKHLLK